MAGDILESTSHVRTTSTMFIADVDRCSVGVMELQEVNLYIFNFFHLYIPKLLGTSFKNISQYSLKPVFWRLSVITLHFLLLNLN